MGNNQKVFLKMMRKGYFALLRVSKLSKIDEFPFRPLTDHIEILTDHIGI
jgi:hypothetical protein